MAFVKVLTSYDAMLYPGEGQQFGRINLNCFEDYKLYLIFLDPSEPLATDSYNATTKVGVAHMYFHKYPHFLDLVRNEKPIAVTFRPEDTPPTFVVWCTLEPPGEGEI